MGSNCLLAQFQSAYRPYHSTETAVIRILNVMIGVVDQGRVYARMLLDLFAAFDAVDHSILMDVMKTRFGVGGNALGWVADFLSNTSQSVPSRNVKSEELALHLGVPLGPRVFSQYAEDVSELFNQHHLRHHLFADDMQCHCCRRPAAACGSTLNCQCASMSPVSPSTISSSTTRP